MTSSLRFVIFFRIVLFLSLFLWSISLLRSKITDLKLQILFCYWLSRQHMHYAMVSYVSRVYCPPGIRSFRDFPILAYTDAVVEEEEEKEFCAHVRKHTCTHTCTHARTVARTDTHTHARTHARTHTHTHTRTGTHAHARTHTHTHAHTHTR